MYKQNLLTSFWISVSRSVYELPIYPLTLAHDFDSLHRLALSQTVRRGKNGYESANGLARDGLLSRSITRLEQTIKFRVLQN